MYEKRSRAVFGGCMMEPDWHIYSYVCISSTHD